MTTEPIEDTSADVLAITADGEPQQAPADGTERVAFTMPGEDDHVLYAVRPKNMILMLLGEKMDAAEEPAATDEVKLDAYRAFIRGAVDPESGDHLYERLGTVTDVLDTVHLHAMARTLLERWTARPFERSAGSRSLPRTTGKPTTGRARSKAKTPTT